MTALRWKIAALFACLAFWVGVAWLLSGCSGSSAKPPAVAAVATEAGCVGFQQDTSFLLYAREHGDCKVAGQDVTIATFNNASARDNYMKIGKDFGGVYGHGNLWVISGQSSAAVAQATKAAGGVSG